MCQVTDTNRNTSYKYKPYLGQNKKRRNDKERENLVHSVHLVPRENFIDLGIHNATIMSDHTKPVHLRSLKILYSSMRSTLLEKDITGVTILISSIT